MKPEGVENESVEQIAFADRVLLNKTDLVSEEHLVELEKRIKGINHAAPILRANLAVNPCPMDFILGINAFDLDKVLAMDPSFLSDQEHQHDKSVTSVGFKFVADFNIRKLNRMISQLLQEKGTDLLRYKGVLSVKHAPEKFVFQGVHMLFDGKFSDDHLWTENEVRENRFIFIGKNLDRQELETKFRSCIDNPNAVLRFPVGTKVEANCEEGWVLGTIAAQREDGNAYRIKLKNSPMSVFAPDDDDMFVRAAPAKKNKKQNKKQKNKSLKK